MHGCSTCIFHADAVSGSESSETTRCETAEQTASDVKLSVAIDHITWLISCVCVCVCRVEGE